MNRREKDTAARHAAAAETQKETESQASAASSTVAAAAAGAARELEEVLEREIEMLRSGLEKAKKVREYIFSHDWKSLSEGLKEMDTASERVHQLEVRRGEIFERLSRTVEAREGAGF